MYKHALAALAMLIIVQASAQTCFDITNRTNGNGNPGTCGGPNCSGNAKTGHIDVSFGASCPGVIPSLELISVTSGSLPSPFCFDPGNCISPGVVRYCFRGNNLPSSGFMTVRLTQGASVWSCYYDVNGGSGQTLPVKLASFEAKLQQQKVLVNWSTEQEFNNYEFQIERSSDNRTFTSIGKIPGMGTSSTTQHYSFVDESPVNGISFYRLRQLDIDGKSSFSSIVRVDNRIRGLQVKQLFPNPVSSSFNLQFIVDEPAAVSMRLFDLSGKQVLFANKNLARGNQNWYIEIPALSSGLYKVVIRTGQGATLTEQIMIN